MSKGRATRCSYASIFVPGAWAGGRGIKPTGSVQIHWPRSRQSLTVGETVSLTARTFRAPADLASGRFRQPTSGVVCTHYLQIQFHDSICQALKVLEFYFGVESAMRINTLKENNRGFWDNH